MPDFSRDYVLWADSGSAASPRSTVAQRERERERERASKIFNARQRQDYIRREGSVSVGKLPGSCGFLSDTILVTIGEGGGPGGAGGGGGGAAFTE